MAEAAGVVIPKGSPDALARAAGAWDAVADVFGDQANRMRTATHTVVGADWHGAASEAYAMHSATVGIAFVSAGGGCRHIAAACRRFWHALREAQDRARDAERRAEDAITRRDAAQRRVDDAAQRATAAATALESANRRAAVAATAGPAGGAAFHQAQADVATAASAGADAE